MNLDRRNFLTLAGATVAAQAWPFPQAAGHTRFCAVVFDAFPIFDARPVVALAEEFFPGKGAQLSQVWRTRQFEYQWLHALAGRYADFWHTMDDALGFATAQLRLQATGEQRLRLMRAHLELRAWEDVAPALAKLKAAGVQVALLSNMTAQMLAANVASAGLVGTFEHVLSTDRIRAYKPEPRAYELAVAALELPVEQILFAAFAGWDAAGAKWFGFPTFWVNRLALPPEQLGPSPDASGPGLDELVDFVGADR